LVALTGAEDRCVTSQTSMPAAKRHGAPGKLLEISVNLRPPNKDGQSADSCFPRKAFLHDWVGAGSHPASACPRSLGAGAFLALATSQPHAALAVGAAHADGESHAHFQNQR